MSIKYWSECIEEVFEYTGINATEDQINTVANWIEGAHENYEMSHDFDEQSEELNEMTLEQAKAEIANPVHEACDLIVNLVITTFCAIFSIIAIII